MKVKSLLSGACSQGDMLPPGHIEITEEEYQTYINPPASLRRAQILADPEVSVKDKKRYLFETLRHKLKSDGSCEEDISQPFYTPAMTVDELQLEYQKYIGDDDERASSILVAKSFAKSYIRSLFPDSP